MKKKFLAVALAAAMAFSTVSALPANTTVAQAAEDKKVQQEINSRINGSK